MTDSESPNRREFVKVILGFLGAVMGTVIGLPAVGYLISPATKAQSSDTWVPLGPLANYQPGVPTLFTFTRSKVNGWEKTVNSYGVYVIKQSETGATVLSSLCTHLSCRVTWKDEEQKYICPCHDAHFSKDGAVASGPPPRALDRYETKLEDGVLYIHLLEA